MQLAARVLLGRLLSTNLEVALEETSEELGVEAENEAMHFVCVIAADDGEIRSCCVVAEFSELSKEVASGLDCAGLHGR